MYNYLKPERMKKENEKWMKGWSMMTVVLSLSVTSMMLTSCDGLVKTLEQLDEMERANKEQPKEQEPKSSLPPIGSRIVEGAVQHYEDQEADEARTYDVEPFFSREYVSEDGAVWTFYVVDEDEDVLMASYKDPEKEGKVQEYDMVKYAKSAYEICPKGRDIAVCIIRVQEDGMSVEEARGVNRKIFELLE